MRLVEIYVLVKRYWEFCYCLSNRLVLENMSGRYLDAAKQLVSGQTVELNMTEDKESVASDVVTNLDSETATRTKAKEGTPFTPDTGHVHGKTPTEDLIRTQTA